MTDKIPLIELLCDTLNTPIDLSSFPTYSKLALAQHQLDRAIRFFLDENDPVCAITLAGASEEILGKLVELQGQKHSLASFIDACLTLGRICHGEQWPRKEFAEMENYYRNELKHYGEGSDITVHPQAAVSIIDRAIENLWRLTGEYTVQVQRYMNEVHGG